MVAVITRIEADAAGKPERVYHSAGAVTVDGVRRADARYAWTHPIEERPSCDACTKGTIPDSVKKVAS
jgi:hypothetical protein